MPNPIKAFLLVAIVCALSGCASRPTLWVRHDPPYQAEPHDSVISITATSQRGIERIDVLVFSGDLVACGDPNGLSSMYPCRRNTSVQTYTCSFDGAPRTATCPVTRTLNALSLVTYRATATDASGASASTQHITYSGGAPPPGTIMGATMTSTIGRYVEGGGARPDDGGLTPDFDDFEIYLPPDLPPQPTAGDVLRPVWLVQDLDAWTYSAPTNLGEASRIDVVFLPDADWGADYRGFSDTTGEIVSGVFWNTDPQVLYAQDYTFWRRQFGLWVGPPGAAATRTVSDQACKRDFSSWAAVARTVTDGQAVVHDTQFIDCSDWGPGAWGTVASGELAPINFAHESGHFLHCMGDEYPMEGIHYSCSDPPNTFQSLADCQATATQYGYPTAWCVSIQSSPSWRISNGDTEIMGSYVAPLGHLSADWQDTNHNVIQRRIAACLLGACF